METKTVAALHNTSTVVQERYLRYNKTTKNYALYKCMNKQTKVFSLETKCIRCKTPYGNVLIVIEEI